MPESTPLPEEKSPEPQETPKPLPDAVEAPTGWTNKEQVAKAWRCLQWQRRYVLTERGVPSTSLLTSSPEDDPDFTRAFSSVNACGGRVLDVGCGWGNLSVQIARLGFDVLGIDLSARAVELASANGNRTGVSCSFLHQNILEMETCRAFDIVTDRGCLAVLPVIEAGRYFEKISQVLKPGGLFFLKIDRGHIKCRPELLEQHGRWFHKVEEWDGHYTRSDGKRPKTRFVVGRNHPDQDVSQL